MAEDVSHCCAADRVVVFGQGAVAVSDGKDQEEGDRIGVGGQSGLDIALGAELAPFSPTGRPFSPTGRGSGNGASSDCILNCLFSKLQVTGETKCGGSCTSSQGISWG